MPNDALFAQQWALQQRRRLGRTADADIDAPEAWNVTTGSPSVLVGVVDTGVDASHPDLAPNLAVNPGESGDGREANGVDDDGNGLVDDVRGWDFAADDNDPNDTFGHGTHVAGTIGARGNDGRGVAGVAWQVGLLPLRALTTSGVGSSLDIAAAMTYAAARGARVVNVSLGGAGYSQAMLDAICGAPETRSSWSPRATTARTSSQKPFYPCAYAAANILCVAATDADDALAAFSNTGAVVGRPRRARHGDPQHRAGRRLRHVQRHLDGLARTSPAPRRCCSRRAARVDAAAGEGRAARRAPTRCPRWPGEVRQRRPAQRGAGPARWPARPATRP